MYVQYIKVDFIFLYIYYISILKYLALLEEKKNYLQLATHVKKPRDNWKLNKINMYFIILIQI